jgi:hypothetical protein
MEVIGFPNCCGLYSVYGLDYWQPERIPQGIASVAVTNGRQERQGTGQQLRDAGYERVAAFTGNSRNILYLYLRQRHPPKPKAPGYYSNATGRRVTDSWAKKNPGSVTKV